MSLQAFGGSVGKYGQGIVEPIQLQTKYAGSSGKGTKTGLGWLTAYTDFKSTMTRDVKQCHSSILLTLKNYLNEI
ncbi:hypothetical protein GPALN_012074 [Globodera pallida]|nr:hypothetical protein GPALN_012074 [Globodera pallida]